MEILKEYPLIDEHGKRYREFGRGCREYAPVIVTSAGEVPMGTVIYKKMQEEPPAQKKDCPFQSGLYPAMQRGLQLLRKRQVQAGNSAGGQALPSPCTFDLRQYLHHV